MHRLFQRAVAAADLSAVTDLALSLARPEELVDVADRQGFAREVAEVYARLRARPEVVELLTSGTCLYELPFSYVPPGRPGDLIRGVIDCVVVAADGTATVVEFKTGMPSRAHDEQAKVYGRALASVLGIERVNVRILYP